MAAVCLHNQIEMLDYIIIDPRVRIINLSGLILCFFLEWHEKDPRVYFVVVGGEVTHIYILSNTKKYILSRNILCIFYIL